MSNHTDVVDNKKYPREKYVTTDDKLPYDTPDI